MAADLLTKAIALYQKKRFRQTINLLEPQIVHHRDDEQYYLLLALACFKIAEYKNADSYLRRSLQLEPHNISALLLSSLVSLYEGRGEEALSKWLAVLDINPRNRSAGRALALARAAQGPLDATFYLLHKRQLSTLVPSVGKASSIRMLIYLLITLGIALVCSGGVLLGIVLINRINNNTTRSGIEELRAARREPEFTHQSGDYRIRYSEQEIATLLRVIERNFLDSRDNLVCRDINRLLHSNAHRIIKAKMRLLFDYLHTPTYVDFRDNFDWQSVAQAPWLYHGCHILWQGRVTNIVDQENSISFDMLVDYQQETVLSGIVSVEAPFEIALSEGIVVEILGLLHSNEDIERITALSMRVLDP